MAEKKATEVQVTMGGLEESDRQRMLKRIEGLTEFPLMVLAITMLPLLIGPFLWDLTKEEEAVFRSLDYFIWAVFAADLVVKVGVVPDKKGYLRKHWTDVIVVVIPVFRPLRILRLFAFGSRAFAGYRRLANVDFLLLYAIMIIVVAAMVLTTVEVGYPGSNIKDFDDALWWAITTVATVGYGDKFPVTGAGRAMGAFLMIGGIALFGGILANITAFFVKHAPKDEETKELESERLIAEIRSLREEVAKLRSSQA